MFNPTNNPIPIFGFPNRREYLFTDEGDRILITALHIKIHMNFIHMNLIHVFPKQISEVNGFGTKTTIMGHTSVHDTYYLRVGPLRFLTRIV